MLHNMTNVILFLLILFFMYVISLKETIHEGWARRQYEKGKDGAGDVVDYTKDSTKAAYNNLADATTQIVEDVIGEVTGILGGALDSLASNVYRRDSTFNSIDNSLTNTSNQSDNFEQDVVKSILTSTSYSAIPMVKSVGGLGSLSKGGGGVSKFGSLASKIAAQG